MLLLHVQIHEIQYIKVKQEKNVSIVLMEHLHRESKFI
jgi:hypothetical protein